MTPTEIWRLVKLYVKAILFVYVPLAIALNPLILTIEEYHGSGLDVWVTKYIIMFGTVLTAAWVVISEMAEAEQREQEYADDHG